MSDIREKALDDAVRLLSALGSKLTKANDGRCYGVNLAYWAMCELRDGKSVAGAVRGAQCVPIPPKGGGEHG